MLLDTYFVVEKRTSKTTWTEHYRGDNKTDALISFHRATKKHPMDQWRIQERLKGLFDK